MSAALLGALVVLALARPAGAYEDIIGVQFVRCYDGDTCTISIDHLPDVFGKNLEVRLRGWDAPERKGRCQAERDRAEAARVKLNSLLASGKVIGLTNVKRDKYFRINASIIVDGLDVGRLMAAQGYLVPYWGRGPRHDWCR